MVGPAPLIPGGFQLYADSFFRLETERYLVQGFFGPIPVTKIMQYGEWLDFEDIDRFTEIIQEVDTYYIGLLAASLQKQMK